MRCVGLVGLGIVTLLAGAAEAQDYDPSFYDDDRMPDLRIVFEVDDWQFRLDRNYRRGNQEYLRGDLWFEGILYPDVGVQYKGDASYLGSSPRENTKITMDAFVPGQELYGYDIITLDAGRQSSVFSEVAAMWTLEEVMAVPLVNLAHLTMGTLDDPVDVGVFTNTERVDGRFVRRRFGGSDAHRYTPKFFGSHPFEYQGLDSKDYRASYYYNGPPQGRYRDVADASIALHNALPDDLRVEVEPYIDLDVMMRGLIGVRMIGNWDSFTAGNNYYLCESVTRGSQMVPVVWDMDLSWTDNGLDPIPDEDPRAYAKIFQSFHQKQRAYSFVRHFLQTGFRQGNMGPRMQDLKALATPFILASPHSAERDLTDIDRAVSTSLNRLRRMRNYLADRPTYQRELPVIPDLAHSPANPVVGDEVWVTVCPAYTSTTISKVLLWSRVTGGTFTSQTMFDDGLSHDGAAGDGVFGALLPSVPGGHTVDYYVEVRPTDKVAAGYGFEPISTSFQPRSFRTGVGTPGPIRLSEFLADNEKGDRDEAGDDDDWIEIVNLSSSDYDLGGHRLTDDRLDLDAWAFPKPTILPAGGRLRVWADDEAAQGPLHASFKLSKGGEELLLVSPVSSGSAVLDELTFPPQLENTSYGRIPESGDHWFHIGRPTGEDLAVTPGSWNTYSATIEGLYAHTRLWVSGSLKVGETMRLDVTNGPPNEAAYLMISPRSGRVDFGAEGILALDPTSVRIYPVHLDATGSWSLSFTVPRRARGKQFFAQIVGLEFGNAVVGWIE